MHVGLGEAMKRTISICTAALAAAATLVAAAPAASAAWSPPAFVRTVGSRGVPGVYGWGIQFNPVSREVLVGDYLNYAVRRYDLAGNELGWFWRPPGQRNGHPESVAVDPRNGDIYASDRSADGDRGVIVKYSKSGTFLWEVRTTASYNAWLTVDDEGYLYVADSHVWHTDTNPPQVRKYLVDDVTRTTTEVGHVGVWGSGPGQVRWLTGIDVDAQHRLYASDTINRTVHVWDVSDMSNPVWLRDIGSSGSGPGKYTGDLRGVSVDDVNGWLYVVDAEGGKVEKFTLDGTPILHWGSVGNGEGQFADGGRQISVDDRGHVWVADYGNFRFMEYLPDGTLVHTYPDPSQPPPLGGLGQPRDVTVDPATGDVWVVETNNQRFQRFAADGTPLGTWGRRNSNPPFGMNYPRGIAWDPTGGDVWLANSSGDQINRYHADPVANSVTWTATYGLLPRSYDPGYFLKPMDIEIDGDLVYVGAYNAPNLKVLDRNTGQELRQISQRHNGIGVDPATHDLYLVTWATDKITRLNSSGTVLGSFGSRGSGPGQFDNPWDVTVCGGVVYTTDSNLHKVVAYTTGGSYLGQWGSMGSGPGQFMNPSGIDHDANCNIYVADAGNDRVVVYSPSTAPVGGDTVVPTASFTSPADASTVPAGLVTLTGNTTDDRHVGTVEVTIRDTTTNKFWDARTSTWTPTKTWNLAGGAGTADQSRSWYYPFIAAVDGRSYRAEVRATDTAGNRPASGFPNVTFRVGTVGPPPDTTPPDATVTAPVPKAVLTATPVHIAGTATDDRSVARVRVAIQDTVTKKWWRSDGTWGANQQSDAALDAPGATSTGWSLDWTPPSGGSGSYGLQVQALDSANNADPTKPWVPFKVTP